MAGAVVCFTSPCGCKGGRFGYLLTSCQALGGSHTAAAAAAAAAGVERLIHFSDMGAAADHPSRRMRTKDQGDEAVRYNFPERVPSSEYAHLIGGGGGWCPGERS